MNRKKTNSTRASRDGHEFHEIWTARKTLQLLRPDGDLVGVSAEGLSPGDEAGASAATIEIADIVLYFGEVPSFEHGARVTIVQFKYSVADEHKSFRASNARKTIEKFAHSFMDYRKRFGGQSVSDRLDFRLVTNQPINESLVKAIDAIGKGLPRKGEIAKQAEQFVKAAGLRGKLLAEFASKIRIIGGAGSLRVTKADLDTTLVDWSATHDSIARDRLGRLKDLVRDKAGSAGTNQNLIARTDVLAALQVGDEDELLPCAPRLTNVGTVVPREQLADAVRLIEATKKPVLIHAAGGVGKTVFMQSLKSQLDENYEVIFFDCFGGGAYRTLDDARHQPKQGLIHIANTLSFRGLCDPMLPGSPDQQAIMRTFRRRLAQCVETMSRVTAERKLVLLIDAIDNAEIAARHRHENSFPFELLQSITSDPIQGVKIVVSCRTHRRPHNQAELVSLELLPFSKEETRAFLVARFPLVTEAEINVAYSRSNGNPRVLDYLCLSGRGLLDESEINTKLELEDLLQKRIDDALNKAILTGHKQDEIDAFFAGLAVLPPPVPLDEYAGAQGLELSAVESFASDMAPLLERSNQGLTFKDEPTETLVRERYAATNAPLRRVADNLYTRQHESVYAARALPGLLLELGDGEQLFNLAFDERMPDSITSTVGKRNIRYARLKAAALYAAKKEDYDRLVRLLIELSTIAAVDQRGTDYILEHPDLVAAGRDADAMRRLFETRTAWPGGRHARLTITNSLAGDTDEAYRHALKADEWIQHAMSSEEDRRHDAKPERPDIAAIPFFLLTQGRSADAIRFLNDWSDWYAYEVCEVLLGYSYNAQSTGVMSKQSFGKFISGLTGVGQITAALSFGKLPKQRTKELLAKLARSCRSRKGIRLSRYDARDHTSEIEDGLRIAAAMALAEGLNDEAVAISRRARNERPGVWAFRHGSQTELIFRFMFRAALVAAAKGKSLHEKDILPRELAPVCTRIPRKLSGADFLEKARASLSKIQHSAKAMGATQEDNYVMTSHERQEAERFLTSQAQPFLGLASALSSALVASPRQINKRFVHLVEAWENARKATKYRTGEIELTFQLLGFRAAFFILSVRKELKEAAISRFLTTIHEHDLGPANLIRIVAVLAQRGPLKELAGTEARRAAGRIESEDDVTYRASLYSSLARAMLPISTSEASHYFQVGLEQMDAIGSGDFVFTNELLLFASTINGDELHERDFHSLSNIVELNLGYEPEKFPWGAFGRAMAKVAGLPGLAKLSRWDDRAHVSLSNTLLPYLIGLVENGKIEPRDAVALNRLAKPVEYFGNGTEQFAEAICEQGRQDDELIAALIGQYYDENPGTCMESTLGKLADIAKATLGLSSRLARELASAKLHHARIIEIRNQQRNYRGHERSQRIQRIAKSDAKHRRAADAIARKTAPADESSLAMAVAELNQLPEHHKVTERFFDAVRKKLDFAKRGDYLRNVCGIENLGFYRKIAELANAKAAWETSSAAVTSVLQDLAAPLIHMHADDLISFGSVSGSQIKEISTITGVPIPQLAIELVKAHARPDSEIPGAAWLAYASFINNRASPGEGQEALSRMLRTDAAELANKVRDGAWKAGLYPNSEINEVAAGLVWRSLGAPEAASRWWAAHAIRDFAALGRWEAIDAIVARLSTTTAEAFQAQKLTFYHMHAKLWLLIALARLAVDYPGRVAKYQDELLSVVANRESPHALMRHFAARALRACVDKGMLTLPPTTLEVISNADKSAHARIHAKIRDGSHYWADRPKNQPKPKFKFTLDYDFHKYDVDGLARVFGKPCWEVEDMVTEIANGIDPTVKTMHEPGGRTPMDGRMPYSLTSRFHGYGQQLGWHALFLTAGRLLSSFPVTDDGWADDPWDEWFGQHLLTRDDGLWLSDGTDRTPPDTHEVFLEPKKSGLVLTGNRSKLLNIAAIHEERIGKEVVVEGKWSSADNIRVHVSSALVEPRRAAQLARRLVRDDPIRVWLPTFYISEEDEDDESLRGNSGDFTPWIVCGGGDARLDGHDPFCVSVANNRSRLARNYISLCKLTREDPFGRIWRNNCGVEYIRGQAWGRDAEDHDDGPDSGSRLLCRASLVKRVLSKLDMELLVLVKLERYEKARDTESRFTHSVAVARISKALAVEYFKGRVNHVHKSKF